MKKNRLKLWVSLLLLPLCLHYAHASSLLNFGNNNNNNNVLQGINQQLQLAGVLGQIVLDNNDHMPVYQVNGQAQENLPTAVKDIILQTYVKRRGVNQSMDDWLPGAPLDIRLLHRYTYQEFITTSFYQWRRILVPGNRIYSNLANQTLWSNSPNTPTMGYNLVLWTLEGRPRFFHEVLRQQANDQSLNRLINRVVNTFHQFTGRRVHAGVALLAMSGALILFVAVGVALPYFGWKLIKELLERLFNTRPAIISSDKTNIVGKYFFQRWSIWQSIFGQGRLDDLPEAYFPAELTYKLDRVKEKAKSWAKGDRKEIANILMVGAPGVGKTLSARHLAKDCGLKYVEFCPADLAQLEDAAALQECKKMLQFCRSSGKCMLFFDEVDQFFEKGTKNKLLQGLFQSELSSGMGKDIWLVGATNFPDQISLPFLDRMPHRIFYPTPVFDAHKAIIEQTLRRYDAPIMELDRLDKKAFEGLSGRETEKVVAEFVDEGEVSYQALNATAWAHKNEKKKTWQAKSRPVTPAIDLVKLSTTLSNLDNTLEAMKQLPQPVISPSPNTPSTMNMVIFLAIIIAIAIMIVMMRRRKS